ncbi:MAG: hypothetical protein K8J08_13965 [Thermoanaerobaculia bacterium]|nr:hypothetical protein [Thermoanaerobaculia bacterium]
MIASPELVWRAADGEALRRALDLDGVATDLPGPGLADYATDLIGALWLRATGWLGDRVSESTLDLLYRILVWTLGLTLLWVVGLLAMRLWSLRRRPNVPSHPGLSAVPLREEASRGPSGSWAEFEALLAAGDVAAALEALWWWVARSIAPSGLDEAWTTDELLAATPQPSFDFEWSMRNLDRFLYGGRLPESDEVLQLAQKITSDGPWRAGMGSP